MKTIDLNADLGEGVGDNQALIALVQREYVSEPLIAVDGWLLAPSEARLYALAAVITTPQRADRPASFDEAHQRRSPGRAAGIAG